jgi:hypothetical protein
MPGVLVPVLIKLFPLINYNYDVESQMSDYVSYLKFLLFYKTVQMYNVQKMDVLLCKPVS